MNPLLFGLLGDVVGKITNKIWPDPEKQAQAQLELAKLAQNGELTEMQTQMSAILAEANSQDPWTSRARPSFMYVMYIMILFSIPMGFLAAFKPAMATAVATGMQAWLAALPSELYTLFGVGYTGYAVMRGVEKIKGKQ